MTVLLLNQLSPLSSTSFPRFFDSGALLRHYGHRGRYHVLSGFGGIREAPVGLADGAQLHQLPVGKGGLGNQIAR